MTEDEGEDEVNTKKTPVKAKENKKKKKAEAKKTKKTAKKITKKEKPNKKKKKTVAPKSVIDDLKKNVKDGKVKLPFKIKTTTEGLFGVAKCRITFQAKKKDVENDLPKKVENDLPNYIVID